MDFAVDVVETVASECVLSPCDMPEDPGLEFAPITEVMSCNKLWPWMVVVAVSVSVLWLLRMVLSVPDVTSA